MQVERTHDQVDLGAHTRQTLLEPSAILQRGFVTPWRNAATTAPLLQRRIQPKHFWPVIARKSQELRHKRCALRQGHRRLGETPGAVDDPKQRHRTHDSCPELEPTIA